MRRPSRSHRTTRVTRKRGRPWRPQRGPPSADTTGHGKEVNPVILRENGIDATTRHSHLLTESPRLFFT
ncbi:MAG: DUF1259 domain-containing protein [Gemmatimonadaceae bacterium]